MLELHTRDLRKGVDIVTKASGSASILRLNRTELYVSVDEMYREWTSPSQDSTLSSAMTSDSPDEPA